MVTRTDRLEEVVAAVLSTRETIPRTRAVLVAISGIDASGKGFVTADLEQQLKQLGWRVAAIGIDGWLNLPDIRFSKSEPAIHFYERAIRFRELFAQLILPLRDTRHIHVEADHAEETATAFGKRRYDFSDVDIILLEGIFLFQDTYRQHFDLTVWIHCSFPTALERAIKRAQENLSPSETIAAFERIYFPAQQIHLAKDDPIARADIIFGNELPRHFVPATKCRSV